MIAGATAGYTLLAGFLSEKCLESTNPIRKFLCDTNEKDSNNKSMPNAVLIAGFLVVICSASATYGAIKNTYTWIKS
ncbi:hypothetical protein NEPTK9_000851 [Candidatus Neptunochlamydia vexilliferae]|uniref:Uncharacterized protein n=1 Tax=Candidatus Neptunichlamydia vexilliferae TaxID=1651774 RepID=A0ABS0AZ00_9BACT|nr:hypothetical protein [Candidatus Neptunochlamydia vexilliferae]